MRTFTADGIGIHVETCGQGPTAVLIHGLGYATWAGAPLRDRLARRNRFVTFDNRGSGRSDKPAGPYSIRLLAEDAASVIAQIGAPVHLIGYSMGGYIALTVALRHPHLVRSLVLMATSAGGPTSHGVPEETQRRWAASAAADDPAEFARRTMPLSFRPDWTVRHADQFEEILRARLAHPTPTESWQAQYDACAAYLATGVRARDVAVPTLVIHGTADRVVPYANARPLAAAIPHAQLVTLPGAGHLCWFEEPDDLTAIIDDFHAAVTAV
ncbi:alpha/beta hydrolase [Micromonospora sp. NBC_00898]|uniref:alpha/beta fold hydrolase n=1 Tax=Micromonospora sp. NBC_00898 TaxID=2975981 RepID=UPI00386FBA33|nr:alpha/beta hydrolase [Micromonospora sp. NBC_00898]